MKSRRQRLSTAIALTFLMAALVMMALGFSGARRPQDLWEAIFAPETDGSWTAVRIDGRPIEPERYRIGVSAGKVSGGRDDCNDWAYEGEPDEKGEQMINTTLVGCPEGDPMREAYWALVYDPKIELNPDGKLRVQGQGHEAILIRCQWQRVQETLPGGGSSDMMRCLPEQ